MKFCLAIVMLVIVLSGCAAAPVPFSPGPPLEEPVATQLDTFVVERGEVIFRWMLSGVLTVHSTPVGFDVFHLYVGHVYVLPGDEVVEGQILARIDTDYFFEEIDELTAKLGRLQRINSLESSRDQLEIDIMYLAYSNEIRYAAENLDNNALLRAERIQTEIEWAKLIAEQSLELRNFEIASIRSQIDMLRGAIIADELFAPICGVVTNVLVSAGDWLGPGDYAVYIAAHNQRVFVEYVGGWFPAHMIHQIERFTAHAGDRIFDLQFVVLTTEQVRYYTRRSYDILRILETPIRFEFVVPDDELPHLGELVTIMAYMVYYDDVLRVPTNAIHAAGAGGNFVLRLVDGMPVQTPVEITATMNPRMGFVAVHVGLVEGDVVIVRP